MRILLAEDEKELSKAVCALLVHSNYSVEQVFNGKDALDYALNAEYDALILDIMMPQMNGIEVLTCLRNKGISVPVLLLTAKSETEDKITGLDCGADDYLTKPFDSRELLARLRAITRRKGEVIPSVMQAGNVTLNKNTYELSCGNVSYRLGNKDFQIMEILMENPNTVISTEKFMEKIWGLNSDAEINVVWVYISALRKKLSLMKADIEIKASRGVGYTLEEKK